MKRRSTRKKRSVVQLMAKSRVLLSRSRRHVVEASIRILECKLVLAKGGKGKL